MAKALLLLGVCALCLAQTKEEKAEQAAAKMVPVIGADTNVKIDSVRSIIDGDKRVGFSKLPALYHVIAITDAATYDVYCHEVAPTAGKTYKAAIDYVDGALSFLKLWPEEKKNLHMPAGVITYGLVFRMLVFSEVRDDPKMPPDIACDIKTENAR